MAFRCPRSSCGGEAAPPGAPTVPGRTCQSTRPGERSSAARPALGPCPPQDVGKPSLVLKVTALQREVPSSSGADLSLLSALPPQAIIQSPQLEDHLDARRMIYPLARTPPRDSKACAQLARLDFRSASQIELAANGALAGAPDVGASAL